VRGVNGDGVRKCVDPSILFVPKECQKNSGGGHKNCSISTTECLAHQTQRADKKDRTVPSPRRRPATRAERPAAAELAATAAWFLAPVPPRRRPSSRWQGGGVHPLVD
jgi:hypothetical protein